MKTKAIWKPSALCATACGVAMLATAADNASAPADAQNSTAVPTNSPVAAEPPAVKAADAPEQSWNWHVQNTDIVDWHPGFRAPYSGPNSLESGNEVQDTVSLDLLAGARLWHGAEFHVDGLMWQGFGFSRTLGVESFPNGEAFRLGTKVPNVNASRVFVRQTIGLGGDEETVEDDALHLAGKEDIARITLTLGKFSAKDIFDNNAYANDPRTQFMSWGLMANEAWDYPADSIGYITGFAAEWNEPQWTMRYGFFQVPRESNGTALDAAYPSAWAMVTELERRYSIGEHPGVVRLLGFLNRAHMGSYAETLANPALNGDVTQTRGDRYKYGYGLNVEQEVTKGIGVFTRLGWSDGHTEAWMFSDVDRTATLGVSINGAFWNRPEDTLAIAGVLDGAARVHREFLAAGGTGILAGDGRLSYGVEQDVEAYYDFQVWKTVHTTLDYQFIKNPAFNRDRGPVSVLSARLHWEF